MEVRYHCATGPQDDPLFRFSENASSAYQASHGSKMLRDIITNKKQIKPKSVLIFPFSTLPNPR
jgi:hypothetical protein